MAISKSLCDLVSEAVKDIFVLRGAITFTANNASAAEISDVLDMLCMFEQAADKLVDTIGAIETLVFGADEPKESE